MGRRHFDSAGLPDFTGIAADLARSISVLGAELREIFVVGSYGRQMVEVATMRDSLVEISQRIEKRFGDVDLLVSYDGEVRIDAPALARALGEEPSEGENWALELWVSDQPIRPRRAGIWRLYPEIDFDVAQPS